MEKKSVSIQTLEDMLRVCLIDIKGSWNDQFPLIDFSYRNIYNSIIGMKPFKELYGWRSRSSVGYFEVGVSSIHGQEIIHESM